MPILPAHVRGVKFMKALKFIDITIFIIVLAALASSYLSAFFYFSQNHSLPYFGAPIVDVPSPLFKFSLVTGLLSLLISPVGLLFQLPKAYAYIAEVRRIKPFLILGLFIFTYLIFWVDPWGLTHWVID